MADGKITEIFASVQGEGLYVGCYQVFVRLAGCNLRCAFCDTPRGLGSDFEILSASEAKKHCIVFNTKDISITGGEPLTQPEFVREFAEEMRKSGHKIHLETNGTLCDELTEVIDTIDVVAMDMKLPHVAKCGELWKEHRRFLEIASAKEVFVKVVCSADTPPSELKKCEDIIRDVNPNIPLIIQPLAGDNLNPIQLMRALNEVNVRCIPQCHKILGLR